MNNYRIESGIQFLTRVKSIKFNLHNLENNLFPSHLKSTDIIEFSSETNFGKNQILLHLIKNAILVDYYDEKSVGGLNSNVLFIDTDFHLEIEHLTEYMRKSLTRMSTLTTGGDHTAIIQKSLMNLTVIRCYDSQQLLVTFHSLKILLTTNTKIKFIILDGIGAHYWQDFMNGGFRKMDLYEKKVLSVLDNCIKEFKLLVLYVRPEHFVMKNPAGSALSSYKVRIQVKDENNSILEAAVTSRDKTVHKKSFAVRDYELIWM